MSEDAKAGDSETREHMGRAAERPPTEPATPEGLLDARALKEYLEAAALPELELIARTPDQLAAIQLAQQIRIAEALERIARALEAPRGGGESRALGDAISSR
jgi:tRNA(Met) C34 N-acetyltransferase TmcA